MSTETVEALDASGAFLYGYSVVHSSDAAGRPLVWLQTRRYSAMTTVSWTPYYQLYTSPEAEALLPGARVDAGFAEPAEPGQTLEVRSPAGTGTVLERGTPGALCVLNGTQTQLACGVSLPRGDGTYAGICAFPLYGNHLQIVYPLPRVLLLFSTVDEPAWTVAGAATGPGVLVGLHGSAARPVSFDINQGWSWGHGAWATSVPAQTELAPLLVQTTPSPVAQARQGTGPHRS